MPQPIYADALATIYQGESLAILRTFAPASVTCVITDPPYSSGGSTRGDRTARPSEKYQTSGTAKKYEEFTGDNRDQRGFLIWSTLWLDELRRITTPGAIVACFVDWRQLPVMTDAMQCAGLVWRGIVPWIKPSCRPQKGRWTSQCEYLVWATNGPRPSEGPCLKGAFTHSVSTNKRHMTEKPVALLRDLVPIAWEPGSIILDPFMGSGTTLRAASELGIPSIGIEQSPSICQVAIERLREPLQPSLPPPATPEQSEVPPQRESLIPYPASPHP